MPDYPYEGQLVADPVTFQRATNAAVTVYHADDTTNVTPLTLKDGSGLPLANPLTSSSDAFTQPFYAPSQDIKLVGAGLTVFVSSAKGMRDAAAASAAAAQAAASEAATAVFAVLEDSTEAVSSSAAAALAAQEAAEDAASAASGGGIGIDPDDTDALILSTRDDGTVITDPSDSDALLITI